MGFARGELLGNAGKDAEIKQSKSGKTYSVCSMGVSTGFGDNKKTIWYDLVAFANKYGVDTVQDLGAVKTGDKILVKGSLDVDEWIDKEGGKHVTQKLIVRDLFICKITRGPRTEQGQYSGPATEPVGVGAEGAEFEF